jgi:hypothetical protein
VCEATTTVASKGLAPVTERGPAFAYSMRLAGFGVLTAVAVVSMAQTPAGFAVSEIARQFAASSLPNPTSNRVVICHGFACKFRTVIAFGPNDHAVLRKIMAKVTSPEAERVAAARAVAWYEKRIAPEAGTAGAKARSTESGDPSQIDCVESSLNTTSALLMLQGLGLLRYHRVEPYESRMLFDFRHFVHSTAVLTDLRTDQKWAVDSWVRNSGELPDVRPLADWYRGD